MDGRQEATATESSFDNKMVCQVSAMIPLFPKVSREIQEIRSEEALTLAGQGCVATVSVLAVARRVC